jgi:hypothetical protein
MKTYTIVRIEGAYTDIKGSSLELSKDGSIAIIRDDKMEIVALVALNNIAAIHASSDQ